jgi:hypothetical protein
MTSKADFTEQEWDLIRAAPPLAGMVVSFSSQGGMFRETIEMGKVYAEARKQHGESELLDEIVAAKPERDHTKHHSLDELKEHAAERLREAVGVLTEKATPDEVDDYRQFVLTLAERVAQRHEEEGAQVSGAEQQAIEEVRTALGGPATG